MIRSRLFLAAFYSTTALFLLFGSPLLLAPRSWAMAGLKAHARVTALLLRLIVGIECQVRGQNNLPAGAVLIAAKHQSAWDTVALVLLFRDPALVMKAELMRIPLYGWFSAKFGMIPVHRNRGPSALRGMVAAARERAAQGRQILVFPEGTRQLPSAPPDYKPGILLLYDALKLPCVPIALNSGHFWPRDGSPMRAGTIVVEILAPLPPGLPRAEFRRELIQNIENATARLAPATCSDGLPERTMQSAHDPD